MKTQDNKTNSSIQPAVFIIPAPAPNQEVQTRINEKMNECPAFTILDIGQDMSCNETSNTKGSCMNIFTDLLTGFYHIINDGPFSIRMKLESMYKDSPCSDIVSEEGIKRFEESYIPSTVLSARNYISSISAFINTEHSFYVGYIISAFCANIAKDICTETDLTRDITVKLPADSMYKSVDHRSDPFEYRKYNTSQMGYIDTDNRSFVTNLLSSMMYENLMRYCRYHSVISRTMIDYRTQQMFTKFSSCYGYNKDDNANMTAAILDREFFGIENFVAGTASEVYRFLKNVLITDNTTIDNVMNKFVNGYLLALEGLLLDLTAFYLKNAETYYPNRIISINNMIDHEYPQALLMQKIDKSIKQGYGNPMLDSKYMNMIQEDAKEFKDFDPSSYYHRYDF